MSTGMAPPTTFGPYQSLPTEEERTMAGLLWTILVIVLVIWLVGLLANITGGGLIHLLLVVGLVILIYNLVAGRRTV